MNERIKELAEQAAKQVSDDLRKEDEAKWYSDLPMDQSKFQEKFAELIVEECRTVVVELYHKTPLELCGPLLTADEEIAKHFYGVDELPVCKHDWYSAKNPVVQNGSVCVICGAIDAREPEELKNE